MRTLDITWMRSLTAVASFGGVRRAAEALHVSQPTVSGHLRHLESELGFEIVARRGRSIAFTSRGEDVLREAHRLVGEHDDAVARLVAPDADDIVIASTQHATEPMVSAVAGALSAYYPRHSIRFRFHRTDRVREFVHHRTADVAIGIGDLGPGTRHIADLDLAWVAAGDRPPDRARLVTFTPPCAVRDRILASEAAQTAEIVRESIDLTSLFDALRTTGGLTALPHLRDQGSGVRQVDGMPHLEPVPLTLVIGHRLTASASSDVVRTLRAAARSGDANQ